jgi:FKBP-type peptidyl-prolyl cis-trans isomerase FkpA
MKKSIIVITALSCIATGAFAQGKGKKKDKNKETAAAAPAQETPAPSPFKTAESGLEYLLLKDVPGPTANVGDFIEMHITTRIGDSLLFDSYTMNDNQPVPFQVQPSSFRGDIGEALTMLSAGDSAIFRVPVDSILKTGVQALPWMKEGAGMKVDYIVHLLSVKTAEQMRADMEREQAQQKETDERLLQEYIAGNKIKATRTASGLYYSITKKGTGATPGAGDSVSMNYTGRLLSGETFDSNVDPAFHHVQPFWFTLGRGQVIQGWDEGIALLPKGTKATLYIPSGLAYGPQSPGPQIPANSILIFDVEVVDVKKAAK